VQVAGAACGDDVARVIAGDGAAEGVMGVPGVRAGQFSAAGAFVLAGHAVAPSVRVRPTALPVAL